MILPAVVAHADWGAGRGKRQLALARLIPDDGGGSARYRLSSLGPVADHGGPAGLGGVTAASRLFHTLAEAASPGQALVGFDFPIGLPRAYAAKAEISSFTGFLDRIGSPPWERFASVARHETEITLQRPFYPAAPGGTKRERLYQALGLTSDELRRRCEKTDAEILFWTLGGKQVGKGALAGWDLIAAGRRARPGVAVWPFDGSLADLLDGDRRVVVAETYPREYYRHFRPPGLRPARWSKRRAEDRRRWIPHLLSWADSLPLEWDRALRERAEQGFSHRQNGEDEFDAVVGLLAIIAVVTGAIPPGDPRDDPAILSVEGWILGRAK